MNTEPRKYGLRIGQYFIRDLTDPQPEEIDVAAVIQRVSNIQRFSNNPSALSVRQHTRLCVHLLCCYYETEECDWGQVLKQSMLTYAEMHDLPESITGDIPGPLKNLIGMHTGILDLIETRLLLAIYKARKIPRPLKHVPELFHPFDKLAETLEWHYVLGNRIEPWCQPIPDWLPVQKQKALLELCREPEKAA